MNPSFTYHNKKYVVKKGVVLLGRRRGVMSEGLKEELAKELGFYDVVQKEGWGGIRAKDAGNMVKRAIELASLQLVKKQ
jgi:small acid-soluble spore protein F (minor alpha/beta-type SASP)